MPKYYHPANSTILLRTQVAVVSLLCAGNPALARESIESEAADTAEVFIYGQQAQNEALLREISDPKDYEEMREARAKNDAQPNENVIVDNVEITQIDGDRATAKTTYSRKHSKSRSEANVYLKRVDGKWEVTTAPKPSTK